MRWIQSENPQHVHIRSLRIRLLLPLFAAAFAVIAIAVMTVFGLADAAHRDAESAMAALARASSFSAIALSPDAVTYRLDARGAVVASSRPESSGKPLENDALRVEVLARKNGAVTLADADGITRIYGFARSTDSESGSAYVVVGRSSEDVFSALRKALFSWAFIGSLLALLALWAAATLADLLLVRRVHKLTVAMRSIVSGNLESRKGLCRGLGELDDLTDIFDAITGQLTQAYSTTDQKVKKRTVELEFNKGMAELEKARTEALLTSVGDGLFATDNEHKITFVNQEGERMIGYTAKELIGSMVPTFLRLEDDKGEQIPVDQRPTFVAVKTGQKFQSPVYPKPWYLSRKNQTRFPVQITVTPIVASGDVVGTIQIFRDITAEVEFDRRKSEFISIASHQLRSPLSATKWLSDMLRKGDMGKLQPKQQDLADKMFLANERMVTLVNELLNVSRLESGTVKLSPAETDIAKLVDDVVSETTPLLLEKKQMFEKKLGETPKVVVDVTLMRELVANLISNASKYSPEGSVVTVTVEAVGSDIRVAIKDQGMGIPQSDQTQLFKKFFRAGNAAKSVVVGTGLGLYVCKAIVELHGGTIGFESAEKAGTTFFFSIPTTGTALKAGEVHLT